MVQLRIFTATGGGFLLALMRPKGRLAAAFRGHGPWGLWAKVLLLPSSAQNTPPGCICGELDYKAVAFYFLFLSQKESSKEKCSLRKDAKGVSPSAEGDQGAALDLPPFEKGGPKL